jgi:hypothetical protein
MNEYIDNNFSKESLKNIALLKGDLSHSSKAHACFKVVDNIRHYDLTYSGAGFWGYQSPWDIKSKLLDEQNVSYDYLTENLKWNTLLNSRKNATVAKTDYENTFVVTRNDVFEKGIVELQDQIDKLDKSIVLIEEGLIGFSRSINLFKADHLQVHVLKDAIDNAIELSENSNNQNWSTLSKMQLRFLTESHFYQDIGRFAQIKELIAHFAKALKLETCGDTALLLGQDQSKQLLENRIISSSFQGQSLLEFPFCITNEQFREIFDKVALCL